MRLLLLLPVLGLTACHTLREGVLVPSFDPPELTRERVDVALRPLHVGGAEFRPGGAVTDLVADGEGALWVAVREGLLWRLQGDTATQVLGPDAFGALGGYVEEGLLGVAPAPGFPQEPWVVTSQTVREGGVTRSELRRWRWVDGLVEPETIWQFAQPGRGHHGGGLRFGPEGALYVGLGDGGSQRDPSEQGQDVSAPTSSILRLRVGAQGPAVAFEGNPAIPGAPAETFAFGVRNPWGMSFDARGRLVIGDVGQDRFEEIDLVPAGANLGWSVREGRECFRDGRRLPGRCADDGFVGPVRSYGRAEGAAVIGGEEVQGTSIPALRGLYVYADHASGRLQAIRLPDAPRDVDPEVVALGRWSIAPTAVGRDGAGELVIGTLGGRVFRVVPGP